MYTCYANAHEPIISMFVCLFHPTTSIGSLFRYYLSGNEQVAAAAQQMARMQAAVEDAKARAAEMEAAQVRSFPAP